MKTLYSIGLATVLAFIASTTSAQAAAVGATAGEFAVQGGQANYTIPLTLPPGLGEMSPELGLVYSSGGGDGPLGMGWTISGIAVIHFCSQTEAQDGQYVPAKFPVAVEDRRFCLDGQRLMRVAGGQYGGNAIEFRTELDSFSRVTSGVWGANTYGPDKFMLETKAGQTITFGGTPDSKTYEPLTFWGTTLDWSHEWYVSKIEDVSGNYIEFEYHRLSDAQGGTPEPLIKSIRYTGNAAASLAPLHEVSFEYELRPDRSIYPTFWYPLARTHRLKQVKVAALGVNVRSYTVNYQTAIAGGRSIITSIQECAGAALSDCFQPTSFEWQNAETQLNYSTTSMPTTWGGGAHRTVGDFDGDGISEIASPYYSSVIIKKLSRDGEFFEETWPAGSSSDWGAAEWHMSGDLDGDGRTDFVRPDGNYLRIRYADNKKFTFASPYIGPMSWGAAHHTFVADVNGDSRADVITFLSNGATVLLSQGRWFKKEFWAAPAANWNAGNAWVGDFDGDGRADIAKRSSSATTGSGLVFLYSDPSGKQFVADAARNGQGWGDTRTRWAGDFDGDGQLDIGSIANGKLYVLVPTKRNGASHSVWDLGGALGDLEKTWAADFNGDGRTDVASVSGSTIHYFYSRENGLQRVSKSLGSSYWGGIYDTWLGDFNGDGGVDLISNYNNQARLRMSETKPLLVTRITSGNGVETDLQYSFLSSKSIHIREDRDVWPNLVIDGAGQPVVSHSFTSHGIGGPENKRGTMYLYGSLRMDPRGRGVLGFNVEVAKDLLTGDYEVTERSAVFPYIGMTTRATQYLADGTKLAERTVTPAFTMPTSASRFPYASSAVETTFDDYGRPLTVETTTRGVPDTYGNFTYVKVRTQDGLNPSDWGEVATSSVFDNYPATWKLGRLRSTTVTHSAASKAPLTKRSSFEYHPQSYLLSAETVEPALVGTPEYLRTEYLYDVFGHKTQIKTTGYSQHSTAPQVRIVNVTHAVDTSARVLRSTTANNLNHQSTEEFSLIHGAPVRVVDANGLVSTKEYDAFGRITVENSLVGTSTPLQTSLQYLPATEVAGAYAKVVSYDTTDAYAPVLQSTVYTDLLDRTIRKDTVSMDGRTVTELTEYNERGQAVWAGRPTFHPWKDEELGASTEYDIRGRVVSITSPKPGGGQSTITYDYSQRFAVAITDAVNQARIETRNALGQLVSVSEGSGTATTSYGYDVLGNLTSTTDAASQLTQIFYDLMGRKTQLTDPAMGTWEYRYNSFGELEKQTDNANQVTSMYYDVLGRMVRRSVPNQPQDDFWTYDTAANGKGLLARVTGADGFEKSYTYNARSQVSQVTTRIKGEVFTTSTVYDDKARPFEVTRPGGFTVRNEYNQFGYMVAIKSPTDGNAANFDRAALQNRFDEMLPLYQSASTQAQSYSSTAAMWESQAQVFLNQAESLRQNALDQDPTVRDRIAQYRQYGEQWMGYAQTYHGYAAESQAQATLARAYVDLYAALESDPYFSRSQWQAILDAEAAILDAEALRHEQHAAQMENVAIGTYEYYANMFFQYAQNDEDQLLAPVASQIQSANTQANQYRVFRDNAERMAEEKRVEAARYDRYQQMAAASLSDADSGFTTWWRAGTTDAEGRITQELLGNGLVTDRDYDPHTGTLTAIRTGTAQDAGVQDIAYHYYANNSVASRSDGNVAVTANYAYDALDRLVAANYSLPNGASQLPNLLTYGYDTAGNIDWTQRDGNRKTYNYTQTASGARRLSLVAGHGAILYDAGGNGNGNITQSGARAFNYDALNRVTRVVGLNASVNYTYAPDNQRVWKQEVKGLNVTSSVYVGKLYERSQATNGNTEHRHYLFAGGRMIGAKLVSNHGAVPTSRMEYYHEDALGSVEVITDAIGRILSRFMYLPFGERVDVSGLELTQSSHPTAQAMDRMMLRGFTGHEQLDELQLIHMNGRVFDIATARFLSPDPFIPSATATQSYNRYAYVHNNPLKYSDPSGHFLKKLMKEVRRITHQFSPVTKWVDQLIVRSATVRMIGTVVTGVLSAIFGPWISAAWAAHTTSLMGGSSGDIFRNTATAYLSGKASTGIANANIAYGAKVVMHGAVGGLSSAATGGQFKSGFYAGAFSALAAPTVQNMKLGTAGGTVASAIVGGTASKLGGGKFANGAVTGAFAYALSAVTAGPVEGEEVLSDSAPASSGGDGPLWRHYTDEAGYRGILSSEMIKKGPNGVVYLTDTPLTYEEVQSSLFIGGEMDAGKGRYMIEFYAKPGVHIVRDSTKLFEFRHVGNIRFRDMSQITYHGKNPLDSPPVKVEIIR